MLYEYHHSHHLDVKFQNTVFHQSHQRPLLLSSRFHQHHHAHMDILYDEVIATIVQYKTSHHHHHQPDVQLGPFTHGAQPPPHHTTM